VFVLSMCALLAEKAFVAPPRSVPPLALTVVFPL